MDEINQDFSLRRFIFGKVRNKITLIFILMFLFFLLFFSALYFNFQDLKDSSTQTLVNFGDTVINEGYNTTTYLVMQMVETTARNVAKQSEIYIKSHPDMTVFDLQKDPVFQKIAVQSVGKTGYTALTDYDTLICRFHINPKIVNLDLSKLSETLPGFWSIMSKTKGGVEIGGFYDWEEADGRITQKYMYIALINATTADGVRMHVATTTYLDEFASPMNRLRSSITNYLILFKSHLDNDFQNILYLVIIFFALFLVFFILIWTFIYKRITLQVKKLSDFSRQMIKRNFSSRVSIKSNDEFESMATAFSKMAEALEKMDTERRQIDRAKTEFLSITSHELRSPMTPMIAQLEMILKGYFGNLTRKQKESLDIVLNNTKRLDNIIVDFLEISRIEAARLKFNFVKKADLNKMLKALMEEMSKFMPEKKINLRLNAEKLPIIEADPDRISQVLRNLINNAVKFSHEGGIIEVSARIESKMILFSVRDKGVGIDSKDQLRLFEPFYQAENMYQHITGGTGLGLAICKGIVESQNGNIWLESVPSNGTIFYFTFPLKPVKNIKTIKLLFSQKSDADIKVKNIFVDVLGPMGENEFDLLQKGVGISRNSLRFYFSNLLKEGILDRHSIEDFKKKCFNIINAENLVHLDSEDLDYLLKK